MGLRVCGYWVQAEEILCMLGYYVDWHLNLHPGQHSAGRLI
jgi:hypothetical protein